MRSGHWASRCFVERRSPEKPNGLSDQAGDSVIVSGSAHE